MSRNSNIRLLGLSSAVALCISASAAFEVINLASNAITAGVHFDPNLINPWGMTSSPTGPFWVANNGTDTSTLYDGNGVPQPVGDPLIVALSPGFAPTGIVYNAGDAFLISKNGMSAPARYIFVGERGFVAGWNPDLSMEQTVLAAGWAFAGPVYKGAAIAPVGQRDYLYVTNFRSGRVEIYNDHFQFVGSMRPDGIPKQFSPFGIQMINGNLYITFALRDAMGEDDVPGPGNGYVAVMTPDGSSSRVLISQGLLDSPWGLAVAPEGFGEFGGALLVGNFGDGIVHAYDLSTGMFLGTLTDSDNQALVIDGLWALSFGNGVMSDEHSLYFTAGPDDETSGAFGEIEFTP